MDKYISKAHLYGAIEELISRAREDYLEKFKISSDADAFDLMECQTRMYERTAFKFLIADFPAADVVPVVRCKDCKFRFDGHYCNCGCWHAMVGTEDDDFCSMGERKEKDG